MKRITLYSLIVLPILTLYSCRQECTVPLEIEPLFTHKFSNGLISYRHDILIEGLTKECAQVVDLELIVDTYIDTVGTKSGRRNQMTPISYVVVYSSDRFLWGDRYPPIFDLNEFDIIAEFKNRKPDMDIWE